MKNVPLTVSIKVANQLGALMRILQIFVRRGYNLHSVIVSPAHDPRFSRLTIASEGDNHRVESDQIIAQLNKLIDVEHAIHHDDQNMIYREFALFKIQADLDKRAEIFDTIQSFKGNVLQMDDSMIHVEFTGDTEKINSIEVIFNHLGLLEMVRSGPLIMGKGIEQT